MSESIIHIKFDYSEAIRSKKDVLLSEMNLIRIAEIIKKFNLQRKEEFEKKQELKLKIRSLKTKINALQKTLPKLKILKTEKKDGKSSEKIKKELKSENHYDSGLANELRDIQERLDALQR